MRTGDAISMSDYATMSPREVVSPKEYRQDTLSPDDRRTRKKSQEKKPRKRSPTPSKSRSRSRSPSRSHSRSRSRSGSARSDVREARKRYSRSPKGDGSTNSKENPKPCRCLGVFGLSLYTKERDLKDMFRKCGSIEDCTIVYDRRTSRSRGFGFVRFKHQEDADEARELMNGKEFDGRKIRVDYSVTQRPHASTPGVYMGKTRDIKPRYESRRERRRYTPSSRSRSRSRTRSRSRSYERRR